MATVQQTATRLAATRRRRWTIQRRNEALFALWLVLPTMATIAAIAFLPLGWAIWLSLWRYNLRFADTPRTWEGLGNYQRMLEDERFHNALKVTGTVAGVGIAAELVLGMVVALAINRRFPGRGMVRAAVLIPWALTTVVAAKMWALIYQTDHGVFNRIVNDWGSSIPTAPGSPAPTSRCGR